MLIYALTDPRDNSIRYIGYSKDLSYRLYRHIKDGEKAGTKNFKTYKCYWIAELLNLNMLPNIIQIEEHLNEHNVQEAEIMYISIFKKMGCHLTNGTDGGDGIPCMSDDIKRKISNSRKGKCIGDKNPFFGKKHSKEIQDKITKLISGKTYSKEINAKKGLHENAHPMFGKHHTPDTLIKISNAKRGQTHSGESKKKISQKMINVRAEIGNPMTGKHHTKESLIKIAAASKGRIVSETTKEKMRLSALKYWKSKQTTQVL